MGDFPSWMFVPISSDKTPHRRYCTSLLYYTDLEKRFSTVMLKWVPSPNDGISNWNMIQNSGTVKVTLGRDQEAFHCHKTTRQGRNSKTHSRMNSYILGVKFILWWYKEWLLFFFFCFFRAAPLAHGGSQTRGLIRAIAAGLRGIWAASATYSTAHGNAGSLTLSKARDRTCNLTVPSRICFYRTTVGNPEWLIFWWPHVGIFQPPLKTPQGVFCVCIYIYIWYEGNFFV